MIYLDNSSTTKQYKEVTEIMVKYMDCEFGNPSSLHRLGISAEKAVKEGRRQVAAGLSVSPDEVFFTSGGTEADNTALLGAAASRKRRGKRIITTAVEHPAVLETAKKLESNGFTVKYLSVDKMCRIDIEELRELMTSDTILVSVMGVNNESGTIMPLGQIRELIDRYNRDNNTDILFHSDLVQAFGKLKMDCSILDMASVSAHKIHGPKGIGAVYVKKGVHIEPFMLGGGQEKHFRSGTENVAAIAGFGKAAEIAAEKMNQRLSCMEAARNELLKSIRDNIKDIRLNSIEETGRSWDQPLCCPSVLNISFIGTRGEVLLHTLEQKEIYLSTGSACSSNKKGGSYVLAAMGLTEKEITGAIRMSLSEENKPEEMKEAAIAISEAVSRFRKLGSFR